MENVNTSKLYNCIILGNYKDYPDMEKYVYYFRLFYDNYNRNLANLSDLVTVLENCYSEMNKFPIEFYQELCVYDKLQLGTSTGDPIKSTGILCNRTLFPFDYNYYKCFKILFDTCKNFKGKKYSEINKYRDIYDQVLDINLFDCKNVINEEKYRNFQYNYHMLVGFVTSYCYYKNLDPERIKDIVEFFVHNHDQIINIFEVNGLTRNDREINRDGFNYYIDFYNGNSEKEELRNIK